MRSDSSLLDFPATSVRWVRGESFRVNPENKETPGPLNRKRSRKGSRGQQAKVAAILSDRQLYLFLKAGSFLS